MFPSSLTSEIGSEPARDRHDPRADKRQETVMSNKIKSLAAVAVAHLGVKCDFTLMMKEMAMRMEATSGQ